MNLKSIYIHTGFHKTGTSSIQDYCAKNSEELLELGLYYPLFKSCLTNTVIINHSEVIYSLFSKNWKNYHVNLRYDTTLENLERLNSEYEYDLERSLSECPTEKILLSGEDISSLTSDELSNFVDFVAQSAPQADIHFITYVRNPFHYFISEVQQTIKGGVDIEQSIVYRLDQLKSLYYPTIESLQSIENSSLSIFRFEETKRCNGGAVGHILDFVLQLKVQYSANIEVYEDINTSMSLEAALILSEINRLEPLYLDGKLNPCREYDDFSDFLKVGGTKFSVPLPIVNQAIENSKTVITYLKNEFNIEYSHTDVNFTAPTWNNEYQESLVKLISLRFPHLKKALTSFIKDIYFITDSLSSKNNLLNIIKELETDSFMFDENKIIRNFFKGL